VDDKETPGITRHEAFTWCDLTCEHADFPDAYAVDGSGTCRTFLALYCKKLGRLVTKNAPCAVRHGERRPTTGW
jgi:hypothetical protein